jgi:uncharacterized protein YaaQ
MMSSDEMKLIIIVVNDSESDTLLKLLLDADYRVTRIASSGGFLRKSSSTLLIGVEASRVERAVKLVRDQFPPSVDPGLKKVAVFVLKVERFEQL